MPSRMRTGMAARTCIVLMPSYFTAVRRYSPAVGLVKGLASIMFRARSLFATKRVRSTSLWISV